MIQNFEDFCRELNTCGFSMGGGNAKGIFALIDYDWLNQDMLDTPVKWHCGDPEVDPWEWRMRVLEERTGIAYSKVFFKASGFITRDWYPYFYAVRRNGETFEEAYERGGISHTAKRIYDIVQDGYVALHEIKALGCFGKEDKSSFDRALVELQMGMFITMTGRKQKKNNYGIEYGWNSTVFTTVENFWAERDFEIPELMLHEMPNKSTYLERVEGYSQSLVELYRVEAKDTILVISNSGRNAVPVEMCLAAKAKGAKVIAMTSMQHSANCASRHSSGKKMYEIADVTIDNWGEPGDAAFPIEGLDSCIGPTSSITGITIAQALVCQVVDNLVKMGIEPPVFKSSNADGGDAHNNRIFDTYYGYRK